MCVHKDPFQSILTQLQTLASLAERAGLATLSQELKEERIPTLQKGYLTLVVLGEFNHGKSTLINRLLGEDILPTGITPTTSVMTRLIYASHPYAKVFYRENREPEYWAFDQISTLIKQEAPEISHVVVGYPSPFLERQLELIDTPGVNDLSQQKIEITYGTLSKADWILFQLDATQILKQSELSFIEQRLLRNLKSRLIFVMSKVDLLDEEELDEVTHYAKDRLQKYFGKIQLFPIAAKKKQNSGIKALKDYLNTVLESTRQRVLMESAIQTGIRASHTLLGNLHIQKRAYLLPIQTLEQKIEQLEQKIKENQRLFFQNLKKIDQTCHRLKIQAQEDIHSFAQAFRKALPREIDKASAEEIQKYWSGFIRDTFVHFLEELGTALGGSLEVLAEEIISLTYENFKDILSSIHESLGLEKTQWNFEINTSSYDLSVFLMTVFGASFFFFNIMLGSLLTLATSMVKIIFRSKVEQKIKEKAKTWGDEVIASLAPKAQAEVQETIDHFARELRAFVEDSGDRFYRQIRESLKSVHQNLKRHRDQRQNYIENIQNLESELQKIFTDMSAHLKALESKS